MAATEITSYVRRMCNRAGMLGEPETLIKIRREVARLSVVRPSKASNSARTSMQGRKTRTAVLLCLLYLAACDKELPLPANNASAGAPLNAVMQAEKDDLDYRNAHLQIPSDEAPNSWHNGPAENDHRG